MLRGIDISNWQRGLKLAALPSLDFTIIKATEGLNIVDSCCDNFVEQAKALGYLWGFYHFARPNDPIAEANKFYKETKNYFGHGLPVLDLEDTNITDWDTYTTKFCTRVHELSGVWPVFYTFRSGLNRIKNSTITDNCPLWCASLPTIKQTNFTDIKYTWSHLPWNTIFLWQFSWYGQLSGWSANLDLDYCYGSKDDWNKCVNAKKIEESNTETKYHLENDNISVEVIIK